MLVRSILGDGGQFIRVMVRVASVVGTWELCNSPFEDTVVLLASKMWRFLDIDGVELVPSVASEAGVNNRILRGVMLVMGFRAAVRRREVAVQRCGPPAYGIP